MILPLIDPAIITNSTMKIFNTVKTLLIIVDFFKPNASATELKKILLLIKEISNWLNN